MKYSDRNLHLVNNYDEEYLIMRVTGGIGEIKGWQETILEEEGVVGGGGEGNFQK